MASSHDGTCCCSLLQRLVAGANPLVCADPHVIFEQKVNNRRDALPTKQENRFARHLQFLEIECSSTTYSYIL